MKFLVDNQRPAALARFPASRGVECQHVLDLDLAEAPDLKIWADASRNDCVVISKDEDPFGECSSIQDTVHLDSLRQLPYQSTSCCNRAPMAED